MVTDPNRLRSSANRNRGPDRDCVGRFLRSVAFARWHHRLYAGKAGMELGERHACARRAGQYRLWRAENVSHSLDDAMEAVRNLLDAEEFDDASQVALGVCGALQRFGQLAGAATFAAEVLSILPSEHGNYGLLAEIEADSHLKLGFTDRGLVRWQELVQIFEAKSMAEPDRADYQRDLSVSYDRLGDLLSALGQGEDARRYYQDSLEIRQRLAESEPDRADYQRDLVVSLIRVADQEPENSEACLRRAVQVLETLREQGRQVEDAEGIMAYLLDRLGQSGGE